MAARLRNRHIAVLVAVVALSSSAGSAHAVAIIVDQSNVGLETGGTNFFNLDLAQSFTPTASSLDVVELAFDKFNISGDSVVRVDIRDGGVAGVVLGSSNTALIPGDVAVLPGVEIGDLTPFLFDTPIALVPGNLYVIDLVYVSGVPGFWTRSDLDVYAGGNSFFDGAGFNADFTFRTGIVPEPSVRALMLAGIALLAFLRRSRR